MSLDRIVRVRRRLIIFTTGGPLASLATAVIAFSLLPVIDRNPVLLPLVGWSGVLSSLTLFVNLLPKRWGHETSDGMKLRVLLGCRPGAGQLIAMHAVGMLKSRNLDSALWNRRWIRVACSGELTRNTWLANFYDYREYLDSSTTCAAQHLESCLAQSASIGTKGRDELILEATVFTAWHRNDARRADEWFKRVVRIEDAEPLSRIRAELALHCVHQRFDEALKKCRDGLALIHKLPQSRATLYEASWLEWHKEIEQRKDHSLLWQQTAST